MRFMRIVRIGGTVLAALAVSFVVIGVIVSLGEKQLRDLQDRVVELSEEGRFLEAHAAAERYVAIARQRFGESDFQYALALQALGSVYYRERRYATAIPIFKDVLTISDKTSGTSSLMSRQSLFNLGWAHLALHHYVEAESFFQRALTLAERAEDPDHQEMSRILQGLASAYEWQGYLVFAFPLYERALNLSEDAETKSDPKATAKLLNRLGRIRYDLENYEEAESYFERAVQALKDAESAAENPDEQKADEDPLMAEALGGLALIHRRHGRFVEAEQAWSRAIAILERNTGREQFRLLDLLLGLADAYVDQQRYAEAEAVYNRAQIIAEERQNTDAGNLASLLAARARLSMKQQKWQSAVDQWRRSLAMSLHLALNGIGVDSNSQPGTMREVDKEEIERDFQSFVGFIKAAHHLAAASNNDEPALAREAFVSAQWAIRSDVARSLLRMAARGSKATTKLDELVRERDVLLDERKKESRNYSMVLASEPYDAAEDAGAQAERLAVVAARITEIDKRLVAEFPEYVALARPSVLDVDEVQGLLRDDEALVLFLDTYNRDAQVLSEETFVWVVTKSAVKWVRSGLGAKTLTRQVAILRCGLDATLWDEGSDVLLEDEKEYCANLVTERPQRDVYGNIIWDTLPFSLQAAYALYESLFGQVADYIAGKHLLLVPSGSLAELPFHVLLTAPASTHKSSLAWMVRSHAITVLPAVSSLKALRHTARPSAATKPLLGVGNPLLDGDPKERYWEARLAKLALENQSCDRLTQIADSTYMLRRVHRAVSGGAFADLDHLRSQPPLPETADEVCAVARRLGALPGDVLLGAGATETAIKTLSKEGKLAEYRVLHFATHGAVLDEIQGTSEPGLILTPPLQQSELDDGYLTASEVAALKLDADWVILSACNTAASGSIGLEALSGLARGFLYAGARALLVSHWKVDSAATVRLVTLAVGVISQDKTVGRAEALRRAMLALIDKGEPKEAHPAFWAPFIVVGEGAAAK